MSKKIIIVGGVAGGASAAARLRRLEEEAQIIMLERDEYISYANCGLPYYIGESIRDRDRLLVQTPEAMKARFNIDVRTNSEVVKIDPVKKTVSVNSRFKGSYEESYDYLILSPGARAIRPNIPGINHKRIFTLRGIPDTDHIKAVVDREGTKEAVVIGGGFVGVEMAENLRERGLRVTLVEAADQILAPLDKDMSVLCEKELSDHGIRLILKDGVKEFAEAGAKVEVLLNSGTKLTADMVLLAIGVVPDTAFLKDSGLSFGPRGHIVVNERLQTNLESIYAVGDAIEVVDYVTKQKTAIPLAGPANKQGRIAADNIAGLNTSFKGSQGTFILKVFGLTAAGTGANEKTLQKADISYKTITIHPVSHASYYPGAAPMTLKLIFNDTGKILGAQGAGYDGVDKRIDVIASVIRLNGTVADLTELELAYAPPYASAKDPVNMAGFVALNVLEGRSHAAGWEEIEEMDKEDYVLVDVRTEMEYHNGHIPGAINIPVDSLRDRLSELDQNKTIVEYCMVGLRGYIADCILSQNGFKVRNVTGGYKSITAMNYASEGVQEIESGQVRAASILEVDPDTQRAKPVTEHSGEFDQALDAGGLCCPGPLLKVGSFMEDMKEGQILKVAATDPGFFEDIRAWCRRTNNELLDLVREGSNITAYIKKNRKKEKVNFAELEAPANNKTLVVFSGDLDKAIASFIIANGAASMGRKVTMFFTFWGLNILRKPEKVKVKKGLIDKMFGFMMPRGSKKLKLSNMNMMGMGAKMIRSVMKNKRVSSLEELIQMAMESGIEIVACQMSMDVMGLKAEELIDGVKIGGVGYYLGEAEEANMNLFI